MEGMALVGALQISELPPPRSGKVRDVYDLGNEVLIVASDRISAFDVIMENGIPGKGVILTQMSNFWFELLSDICPNHLVETSDDAILARVPGNDAHLKGRSVISRKAKPLPIECVVRGYITGSLLKEYRADANVHGLNLPSGLEDGSLLPQPIFTPATKAAVGHDENISAQRARDLVGAETYEIVEKWSIEIYRRASDHAAKNGIILADTKFEFGWTDDGVIWIDEALTPDSSRFWPVEGWKPGQPQPSFDKQFVRDYLEQIHWDKTPPGPRLPDTVVAGTQKKYIEAFERLTGKSLHVLAV